MKNRRGEYLYFCSAEQDSLYALTLFREKEKQGTLNVQETGLLLCMAQRAEDSWIYLMPAAVYAAANQKGARLIRESFSLKASIDRLEHFYEEICK